MTVAIEEETICPICFTNWTWVGAYKLLKTERYINQREVTSDVLWDIANEYSLPAGCICIPCRMDLAKPEEYKTIRLKLALRS